MVGMKAIVESATVEQGSIVAAGAVVKPDTVVGAGQVGVPCLLCTVVVVFTLSAVPVSAAEYLLTSAGPTDAYYSFVLVLTISTTKPISAHR